jgi:class 3 adenylate cyclase
MRCAVCGRESPQGFAFCPGCGSPLAGTAAPREVRKTVTVVFCDLTGSTALGAATDPETLRRTMRGYHERMRAIVERHGGTVEKFIGDAVMAVFGVPVAHEDDALRPFAPPGRCARRCRSSGSPPGSASTRAR